MNTMAMSPRSAWPTTAFGQVVGDLNDPEYLNWFKANRALHCTVDVLRSVSLVEVNSFHGSLLRKLGSGTCSVPCTHSNIKQHNQWRSWSINCPNKVCSRWLPDIVKERTEISTRLTWENSKFSEWPMEPWQLAKIYMNHGQDPKCVSPCCTDAAGIIQLLLNFKRFQNILDTQNVDAVRILRNNLMHSCQVKLSASDLTTYIQTMVKLLEDPKKLQNDPAAIQAVTEIKKIETTPVEVNNTAFLAQERLVWKEHIAGMAEDNKQDIIKLLRTNTNLVKRLDGVEQESKTQAKKMADLQKHFPESRCAENMQVNELRTAQKQLGHIVSQHQHQLDHQSKDITELQEQQRQATKASRQHVKSELKNVNEQLRKVHMRTIDNYLKSKGVHEGTMLKSLDDIYINLQVHSTSEEYQRLEMRSNVNNLEKQMDIKHCKQIKVEDLFLPDAQSGKRPLRVLVTGVAGIGKSTLTLRLLDMCHREGEMLPHFKNVHFFSLHNLSHISKCSLVDLLFTYEGIQKPSNDAICEYLTHMMEKTLFVFDSLDEFGSYSSTSESKSYDPNEKIDISQLIGSIICGKMLPLASLLVTSRLGGVIEHKVFDRITEIYGFTEDQIFEYVHKFCIEDISLESNICTYLKNDINMRSICYVPMLCNLFCRTAKLGLKKNCKEPFPATITQLLTRCVVHFAIEHHPNFKGIELTDEIPVISRIRNELLLHSQLAKRGMSEEPIKVIFSKQDVDDCGLSMKIATECGLLTISRGIEPDSLYREVKHLFYFLHLLFQEFFAGIGFMSHSADIKMIMERTRNEGQLDMVLLFIFGLVGNSENIEFLKWLGLQSFIQADALLRLVIEQEREHGRRDKKDSMVFLLLLVYESQQQHLWHEIKDFVLEDGNELNLDGRRLSPAEQKSLAYVMPNCDDVTILSLDHCIVSGIDVVMAIQYMSQLKQLRLTGCGLTMTGVTQLSLSLSHLERLEILMLGYNSITDKQALKITTAAVKLPNLRKLELYNNYLTEEGIETVRGITPQARVMLPLLDWQRPPRQKLYHPDLVLNWQQWVTNLETGMSRLHKGHVRDVNQAWLTDLRNMKVFLDITGKALREAKAMRETRGYSTLPTVSLVVRPRHNNREFTKVTWMCLHSLFACPRHINRESTNSLTDDDAIKITTAAVVLPCLGKLRLWNNYITKHGIERVRRILPRHLVESPFLDLQKLLGQELIHPNEVIDCQQNVTNLEVALSRLCRRNVEDRDRFWPRELVRMKGFLASSKDYLRLVQDQRARTDETIADVQQDLHRLLQIYSELKAVLHN